MDEFEYVMVLVSIIMGLGITHILFGFGGLVDRLTGSGPKIELSLAHTSWLARIFFWMVMFWWWEFRFSELEPDWGVGLYLFLVGYAVLLFLLAVVLVPRSWEHVKSLNEFFIQRRAWFYPLLLVATVVDLIDGYLKGGWEYYADAGAWVWALYLATLPAVLIGVRSTNPRHHAFMGCAFFLIEAGIAFDFFPRLGF